MALMILTEVDAATHEVVHTWKKGMYKKSPVIKGYIDAYLKTICNCKNKGNVNTWYTRQLLKKGQIQFGSYNPSHPSR